MSSTNKTTNYELSQFLGTDKPAWLTDYNSDMSKIDAGVHTAQTTATGADGKADANTTNIGTLANLTTSVKTDLVSAINEVDGNADAAALTAGNAATTANQAKTTADNAILGLQRFNLTDRQNLTTTSNYGTISQNSLVQYAGDTTKSIFKVYGRVYISGLSGITGTLTVKLGDTPLRPEASYTINTGVIAFRMFGNNTVTDTVPRNLTVNTDGSITVSETLSNNITSIDIMIPPCLYFNADFGDQ